MNEQDILFGYPFFKIATRRMFAYLSVVLFTNSPFQRPHVNSRAVTAKNIRFIASSTPMGPKKYARISMSPARQSKTDLKFCERKPRSILQSDYTTQLFCSHVAVLQ